MSLQSIQASANRTKTVAPVSWSTLSSGLSADDAPGVGYKEFVARWNDPNDAVMQKIKAAKLVKKFDSNGIVLNTQNKGQEAEVQAEPDNTNVLDQTAMSAAKRMK
jgi:hypothetical protein